MVKVAVIFHSATGTTKQLAEAVVAGALSVTGVEVVRVEILGTDIVEGRFKNSGSLEQLKDVDVIRTNTFGHLAK